MNLNEIQEETLRYYQEHAQDFVESTRDVDLTGLYEIFLEEVRPGGTILDLGCGSGRDSRAFKDRGYGVVAVDGSAELCEQASQFLGEPVLCSTFADYVPEENFAGIWACASLLHLPFTDIKRILAKLGSYLEPAGVFYLSFKYGNFAGFRRGRYFTDLTEERFRELLEGIPALEVERFWLTSDARPGREAEKWLNVLCRRI